MTLTILIMALGFVVGLAVRKVFPHLCAICFSVSSTWLILLTLLFKGEPIDPVIIAMLIGGSVVGVMYYLGGKVKDAYQVFKFPFLVTAFIFTYAVVAEKLEPKAVLLAGFLWTAFGTVFALRDEGFKKIALKLIECCKNW
jgi:hypothetical protein